MKDFIKNIIFIFTFGFLVLLTQKIGLNKSILGALPGMLLIIAIAIIGFSIKFFFPKSIFPAFGWVTILGFIASAPFNPYSTQFMSYVKEIDFLSITTPLLAFAGISVGNKINDLKKMSWKIVLISVIVFITIFFACALIAQTVLKLRGEI